VHCTTLKPIAASQRDLPQSDNRSLNGRLKAFENKIKTAAMMSAAITSFWVTQPSPQTFL
jgi:hypothetical protein